MGARLYSVNSVRKRAYRRFHQPAGGYDSRGGRAGWSLLRHTVGNARAE